MFRYSKTFYCWFTVKRMENENSNDSCEVFDEEEVGVEETKQEEVVEASIEAPPVKQSEEKNEVEVNAKEERAAQLAHARKKAAAVRREKYAQREQDRIERAAAAVMEKMMKKRQREEEEKEQIEMKKRKHEAVAVKKKSKKTSMNSSPYPLTSDSSPSNSSPETSPVSSPERNFVSGKKLSKSEMLQYHVIPATWRNPFS